MFLTDSSNVFDSSFLVGLSFTRKRARPSRRGLQGGCWPLCLSAKSVKIAVEIGRCHGQ